ncbi:legumain-like [Carassius carassius]|uniref:legumain-like n=1 Tax=Carassius carassius TaxID=217509 RepID=UPI002868FD00|nr:legumain-like [Carassius carassius]XP_059379486.1 legumain-like [Carassius carassius]XP_059379487.1 legumain-like [Carassius carassius]
MVIFMTSSYSATMFEDLAPNVDAYALTACTKYIQSSPSDYNDIRKIYLSDKFSSAWLKDINEADFKTETFHGKIADKQANHLKRNNDLCPCQFGNLEIRNCHLSEFLQK